MNPKQGSDQESSGRKRSGDQSKGRKKRGKRGAKPRSKQQQPSVDTPEFWGDPEALPDSIEHVKPSPEPTAVVSSLGRIPIPPHETAAEHTFQLVYQRAAMMASALAAASGLDGEGD